MSRKLGQIIAVRENTWMIRIPMGCDPQTKQRSYYNRTVHGSLRQAQKFLGKKINELGAYVERDGAKIRLDQYLDQWLKTMKSQICGKTYESYESLLAKYIRPSLGKKPLVGIRPLDVQGVYQQMSDRGLSPRTVQGAHWVLNASFRQALQWEMIMEVPTRGLKLPPIRRREMRVFSVEEAKTFLKFALPTMYGSLFAVAITTGMRPSEYIGLKWQHIDWERGTVSVKRTLRKGPTGQWEYGETKRAGSRRLIRLQNWVLARLKQLKELQTIHPVVDPEEWPEAVDLIFVTEFGRPVNVNSLVYKHFKLILKRAGLPNIRLYDLRHTAANPGPDGWRFPEGCLRATRAYECSIHIGCLLACTPAHAGRRCGESGSRTNGSRPVEVFLPPGPNPSFSVGLCMAACQSCRKPRGTSLLLSGPHQDVSFR